MPSENERLPCHGGRRWQALAVRVACAAVASCGGNSGVGPEITPAESAIDVLFVGNSLTYFNDLPGMVASLLDSAGIAPARVAASAYANFGLQDHWVDPRTTDAIRTGDWDWVILQQGPSATEGRPSLLEYTQRFAPLIRDHGAEPALYMVWPSVERSFDFDGVSQSYADAAHLVDGRLLPAGEAWRAAWRMRSDLSLYGPDGFHPSVLGSYVAALTIVESLSDRPASMLPSSFQMPAPERTPVSIDPAVAAVLREAASEANRTFGSGVSVSR